MREDAPWEPVPGFPGYERNRFGEFRSWIKIGGKRTGGLGRQFADAPRPVPQWLDKGGYLRVSLSSESSKTGTFSVAATVLELNVGPRPDGMMVCHFPDRTRTNNDPSNLRWGTAQDNVDDMQKHGTHARGERSGRRMHPERYESGDRHWARRRPECVARGDRHSSRTKPERTARGDVNGNSRLKELDVVEVIAQLAEYPRKRGLLTHIAKRLGVWRSTIAAIDDGETWAHIPRPSRTQRSAQLLPSALSGASSEAPASLTG